MTKAISSLLIFAALLVVGQSKARPDQSAARHASLAQVQSPSLRLEFDKNMRSRVVARFDGKEVPLGPFSCSETIKGKERSWRDFALASQTQEPYFGDHVELSDNHDDFASTLGIGGVVGTQFVLPSLVEKHGRFDLTPDHEKSFQKWLELYQEKGLSRGQYLGTLYDIGFDLPEAHVIRKNTKMYYAFFAATWKGSVELRGLDDRAYHVVDYVDGKDFGTVRGPIAHLSADFSKHLLLEATPQ